MPLIIFTSDPKFVLYVVWPLSTALGFKMQKLFDINSLFSFTSKIIVLKNILSVSLYIAVAVLLADPSEVLKCTAVTHLSFKFYDSEL